MTNKKNGICPKCEYQICRCAKIIKVEIEIIGTAITEKQIREGRLTQSLYNDFLDRDEKIAGVKLVKRFSNYEKGFNILMEYFDSINDEEKEKVNRRLKRCGL